MVLDLCVGDIVFFKDLIIVWIEWLIGIIINVIKSVDGWVCKVEVKVLRDGKLIVYMRFILDIIFLIYDE